MRHSPAARRSAVIGWLAVATASVASAQDPLREWTGEGDGDEFGARVLPLPDVNGDGIGDYALSAPSRNETGNLREGKLYVYSGAGGLLWSEHGNEVWDYFGLATDHADLDGDGTDDLLVGMPGLDEAGSLYLLEGRTGNEIARLRGSGKDDWFGATVAALDDLDGDGVREFAVGATGHNNSAGRVYLYSGASRTVLSTIDGPTLSNFGRTLVALDDLDGDGFGELAISSMQVAGGSQDPGTVSVYSPEDRVLLLQSTGENALDDFGRAIAGTGDLDGDGFSDLLIGAPSYDALDRDVGAAYLVSFASGRVLRKYVGQFTGDELGRSVAAGVDVDGRGVPEFLVGVPGARGDGLFGGQVLLYSGVDQRLLYEFTGVENLDRLGADVAMLPDRTGDGIGELLLGSSQAKKKSPNPGKVGLFAGWELYLNASIRKVKKDETVVLSTRIGDPGARSVLAVIDVDGVPTFQVLDLGPLDSTGTRCLTVTVPGGLSGHRFTLRSYVLEPEGILASNEEVIEGL